MHFAAFAYVGVSVREPAKYYHNNIVGTLALLDAMRAADVKRIVFSSTCATYGIPTKVPIREDHPQAPINPYGFTKLAIERALADYAHAYGLGYAALRYFNASGAAADGTIGEDHDPETHLIPLVLQVALGQRESVDVFGTDYPDAGRHLHPRLHPRRRPGRGPPARRSRSSATARRLKLNLGTGRGASVQEVVDIAREVTGHKIPTQTRPAARRRSARTGRRPGGRQARARLGSQAQGHARHHRIGLALAQEPSARLRRPQVVSHGLRPPRTLRKVRLRAWLCVS